jgi:hypothetical protein
VAARAAFGFCPVGLVAYVNVFVTQVQNRIGGKVLLAPFAG